MLPERVKLILHSQLEDREIFDVGWFPEYLETGDKDIAKALCCLEIRIDGLRNDDELYVNAGRTLTEVAWRLCNGKLGTAYVILVEHRSLVKSRVRAYKGLFPYKGQIKKGDFIEYEAELDNNWSFFMGIAPVIEANRDEVFLLMKDSSQAFILLSIEHTETIYGIEFLRGIIPCLSIYNSPNNKGGPRIDYMKLIPRVCKEGLVVLSFGLGDSRGEYVNIRLFFQKEIENLMQEATNLSVCPAV